MSVELPWVQSRRRDRDARGRTIAEQRMSAQEANEREAK